MERGEEDEFGGDKMANIKPVNLDTGEVVTTTHGIFNIAQSEGYKKHKEREKYIIKNPGHRWVASYHDPIRNIIKDLSLIEAGAIVKLLPYLRFKGEGKLIKDSKPIKQADIQSIFKRGKKATREILERLQELGVIQVLKDGRNNVYVISANFHTMGEVSKGVGFTKLYREKTNDIVSDLDLNETGLLYKILPFFHYQTYYLCANPDEPNPEVIQHLNREQLAEAIGHDAMTTTRMVDKLRAKGVIMTTSSGNSTLYLVHPDVMFRKEAEDEYTTVVRRMFEEHMKKRRV